MFVPGNKRGFLDRAAVSEADAVLLYLEDGVVPFQKAEARTAAAALARDLFPMSTASPDPAGGLLDGIRVVAVEQAVALPFATFALAEFGADVIKLEPPAGGLPEAPAKIGIPVTDLIGDSTAFSLILGALLDRQRTGRGRHLDVAMLDSVLSWLA
jgi:hypothetical protein